VKKDIVKSVSADVIVTHQSAQHVLMMFVQVATAQKMIVRHETFVLDLGVASKGKLYKDGKLMFMGDAYKAISILIRSCDNPGPVEQKFNSQLTMREKCKFTKQDTNVEKTV